MSLQVWLPFVDGTLTNNGFKSLTLSPSNISVQNNGKLGKCLAFNGTSSIITSTEKVGIIGDTSYTIAFWMYWAGDTWTNDYVGIVGWGQMGTNQGAWAIIHNGKPDLDFWNRRYEATTQLQVKRWYHIVMVKTPGDMSTTSKLYVDGLEVAGTPSSTETPSIVDGTLLIGRLNNSTTRWFNGYLNDVRIYDEALDPLEIKRLSQGLVLHYPMNDAYIEPSINHCIMDNFGAFSNSVWGAHTSSATIEDAELYPVPTEKCSKLIVTYNTDSSGGGLGRAVQTTIPVKPSTAYTYSCYIWASDDFAYTHANFLYRYEYSGDTWSSSARVKEGGLFAKTRMVSVGGGWYRCWGTFTTQDTANWAGIYFYTYPDKDVTYLIGGWQLEESDHMTPYRPGTLRIAHNGFSTTTLDGVTYSASGDGGIKAIGTSTGSNALWIMNQVAQPKSGVFRIDTDGGFDAYGVRLVPRKTDTAGTTTWYYMLANQTRFVPVNAGDLFGIYLRTNGENATVDTYVHAICEFIPNDIYDASGYGNNGYIARYDTSSAMANIEISTDSPRYSTSTVVASANATTNASAGTAYIVGDITLTTTSQLTVAFWMNALGYGYGNSYGQGIFCTTAGTNSGTDYLTSAMNHYDNAVRMNGTDSSVYIRPSFLAVAGWHHYAFTYDGQVGRVYKDGVQTSSASMSSAIALNTFNHIYFGYSRAGGVWRRNNCQWSDCRVYATALSADDVKALYEDSAYIATDGTGYAYEFVEE